MRNILAAAIEILGALLITVALLSIGWQWAALWFGAALIVISFALDRPAPTGGDR